MEFLPYIVVILVLIAFFKKRGLFLLKGWPNNPRGFADGESASKKKSSKFQFKDSGWILLYVICGWFCIIIGVTILVIVLKDDKNFTAESASFIFFAFLASLSCFFAAHVLRLQEKTAHHAEKNSELLKIIVDQTKKIKGE